MYFRTAIEIQLTLLPSETLGLLVTVMPCSRLPGALLHLVELEWLDDGFDFFTERSRAFPYFRM